MYEVIGNTGAAHLSAAAARLANEPSPSVAHPVHPA